MSSRLENCTIEVFDIIFDRLNLEQLCQLRLTSSRLSSKVTQGRRFRSFFRSRSVEITQASLADFVQLTASHLGQSLQHLTLVGIVNNTKLLESLRVREPDMPKRSRTQQDLDVLQERIAEYEELHSNGSDVDLLSKSFNNIKSNCSSFESISLRVVVYREDSVTRSLPVVGGSWTYIWKSAAETFQTTMSSLATSKLSIKHLDLFDQLQRCSLASNELGGLSYPELAASLRGLQSLSLSFSSRVIFDYQGQETLSNDPAESGAAYALGKRRSAKVLKFELTDESNFDGLAKLLQLSPEVQRLNLHQYSLERTVQRRQRLQPGKLFRYVADMRLSCLQQLELRGVDVSEVDLCALVKTLPLRALSLHSISMSVSWRSLFDHCSEDPAIETLRFSQLAEQGLSVLFDDSSELDRTGGDARMPIVYRTEPTDAIASPLTAQRYRERAREFGPPDSG